MDRFVKRVLRRNEAYFGEARKRPLHAPHPQSLPLRGGGTRSVTERCAAAQAPSAQAGTLRQAFGAVTPLRRSAPAPLKGSLPSQATGPKPPLEGRWHAKRDGEVCRRAAAAARKRPSAHADALRQTFGAVTPLSQPTADSSPQGEPSLSADGAPKPPLEGRWHGEAVTERCAARRAAARQRLLHTLQLCGKPSVR